VVGIVAKVKCEKSVHKSMICGYNGPKAAPQRGMIKKLWTNMGSLREMVNHFRPLLIRMALQLLYTMRVENAAVEAFETWFSTRSCQ
jgi:hypothetical protein